MVVRQPSDRPWIPLIEALTWLRNHHSCDLDEHLAGIAENAGLVLDGLCEKEREEALTRMRYGFPEPINVALMSRIAAAKTQAEASRLAFQNEWSALAGSASEGKIQVRGRPIGQPEEIELSADDVRNCGFLSWRPEGPQRDLVARVERVDGSDDQFDGAWKRLHDERNPGFHYIFVNREQLLKAWPAPARKLPLANERKGRPWLFDRLRQLSPRSTPKAEILAELIRNYPMSNAAANRVWNLVTEDAEFQD